MVLGAVGGAFVRVEPDQFDTGNSVNGSRHIRRLVGGDPFAPEAGIDGEHHPGGCAGGNEGGADAGRRRFAVGRQHEVDRAGQLQRPLRLVGADNRVGDEQPLHSGRRERLRLAKLGDAQPVSSVLDLPQADFGHAVRLGVGEQLHLGRTGDGRHLVQVAIEHVEVDHEARRRHRQVGPAGAVGVIRDGYGSPAHIFRLPGAVPDRCDGR
mgnify:CR=1 FL=1